MFQGSLTNRVKGILFLALVLGISGCKTTEDCNRLRNTQVLSMPWDILMQKCSKCLSTDEIAALRREKKRFDDVNLSDLFGVGMTVQEVLAEEKSVSSFDPGEILGSASPSASLPESKSATPRGASGPWVIPESVFFVFKDVSSGGGPVFSLPDATAFVLSVPDRQHTKFVRFLVTARHVLDPKWAHCSEANPSSITVRMNKRTGGVGYETIPLEVNQRPRYITPADDVSDIAVIFLDRRLIPNLETYKFIDVYFRLLPTDSDVEKFRAGQQIMTAGLMPQFPGEQENYPIFRSGVLSNMPHEPVQAQCHVSAQPKSLRVWFITAKIPRGVSGAPVFTVADRGSGANKAPVLVGIQSISWEDQEVAAVTPSGVLGDLVQSVLTSHKFEMDFYKGP